MLHEKGFDIEIFLPEEEVRVQSKLGYNSAQKKKNYRKIPLLTDRTVWDGWVPQQKTGRNRGLGHFNSKGPHVHMRMTRYSNFPKDAKYIYESTHSNCHYSGESIL